MAGYMGDKSSMIVHHLAMMTPDCRIYDIKKENMLLKRPVIEYNGKALCAFDEELYKTTFL